MIGDLHAHGIWEAACRQRWADRASPEWQGKMKTWATPRRGQGAMEGFGFSQPPLEADGRGASQSGGRLGAKMVGDGKKRSDLGVSRES